MQAIKVVFIQIVIASLGLCLLWQSRLARQTGHQLDQIQKRASNVEAQIQRCEAHLSKLKSPQRIMRLVQTLDLNLVHPTVNRIAFRPRRTRSLAANSRTRHAQHMRN